MRGAARGLWLECSRWDSQRWADSFTRKRNWFIDRLRRRRRLRRGHERCAQLADRGETFFIGRGDVEIDRPLEQFRQLIDRNPPQRRIIGVQTIDQKLRASAKLLGFGGLER